MVVVRSAGLVQSGARAVGSRGERGHWRAMGYLCRRLGSDRRRVEAVAGSLALRWMYGDDSVGGNELARFFFLSRCS